MAENRTNRPQRPLRSGRWFDSDGFRPFDHRSRMAQMGWSEEDYRGKPVIGILSTWSDLNPCHKHLRDRVESVKHGVWQNGGFPVELPALSLDEAFMRPTAMLYRNLLSLEAEEIGRCHPIDGLVLLGGCDKTTPGLMMGAISLDLPSIFVPAGFMVSGLWRGRTIAIGTDTRKYYGELRAGTITQDQYKEMENCIGRSYGTCMTGATASTMTIAVEAMGFSLPGAAGIPAVDAAHSRMASESGRRIVDLVRDDLKPSDIISPDSLDNAITAVMAMGGSTNAIIHLIAMAGRSNHPLDLARFDEVSRKTPLLTSLRPSGQHLMEDMHRAGGTRAFLERLRPFLKLDTPTVSGRTLGENIKGAEVFDQTVIRPLDDPLRPEGGIAVLHGTLAPCGAVIKQSAADPALLRHTGPAVVFENYEDLKARIDDPDLPVTRDSVIVLRQSGPQGGIGMPETGMIPIPKKLIKDGVRDVLRISDARMSGGSFGACVVHAAPESHVGGPIALVRDGDLITIDVDTRRLDLLVDEETLEARRAEWKKPAMNYKRGWVALHMERVTQADRGCDFDFLQGSIRTPEPPID